MKQIATETSVEKEAPILTSKSAEWKPQDPPTMLSPVMQPKQLTTVETSIAK